MVIKGYTSSVNLRAQPPGRAKQSLIGTHAAALAQRDDELIAICEYGLEWVDAYIARRARRRLQRVARSDGEAKRLDRAVDNFLGDIHRALERAPGRYPHHPERHAWAAQLKATYFPDGAYAITSLPYEEELVVAEYIHHHLTTEHAAWCRALRIAGLLEDLGEVLPAYRVALTPDDLITIDEVNEAFGRMQHALCAAVAHVLGRYWRLEDVEKRDGLLRAIRDQDQRMADLLAGRRRGDGVSLDDGPGDAEGAPDGAGDDPGDVGEAIDGLDADGGEAAADPAGAAEQAPGEGAAESPAPRPLRPLPRSEEG